MVVSVLEEPRIDLHLAAQYGLHRLRHIFPRWDLRVARGEPAVLRDHTQLLLSSKGLLAQLVPALVELALVLVGPLLGYMMWRVGSTRREVDEERLVGCQRLLLRDPGHCLVGHIRHEVVALFGRLLRL